MKSKTLLNYLSVAGVTVFLWLLGFISVGLIGASLRVEIHSLFTLLLAIIMLQIFYKILWKARQYRANIGIKFIKDFKSFISKYKTELIISVALYATILNKNLLPSNPVLDLLSIFITSLGVIAFKLNSFFSQSFSGELFIISDGFNFILQLTFVFLIVQTIASFFRKKREKRPLTVKPDSFKSQPNVKL